MSPDPDLPPAGLRAPHLTLLVLLLLLAGAVGVVVGQRVAPTPAVTDPVSIGFARDMQAHHAQAVAMSAPLHQRTEDDRLVSLAFDIMTTQQGQIGIMRTWLDLSPEAADVEHGPSMAWMGHEGTMPGMATPQEVASLATLPLAQAEERYLRLMVRHHRGALPMAQHAADHAEHPQVRLLAQQMHDGQASEIGLLQDLLADRGLPPEPEPPAEQQATGSGGGHAGHG